MDIELNILAFFFFVSLFFSFSLKKKRLLCKNVQWNFFAWANDHSPGKHLPLIHSLDVLGLIQLPNHWYLVPLERMLSIRVTLARLAGLAEGIQGRCALGNRVLEARWDVLEHLRSIRCLSLGKWIIFLDYNVGVFSLKKNKIPS